MGDSMKAAYEMEQEELYEAQIIAARKKMNDMSAEEYKRCIEDLFTNLRDIENHGVGNRNFWNAVTRMRNLYEHMKF
jgi:hypothetical protein